MATVNPGQLYKYIGYPTFAYQLQSSPWPDPLVNPVFVFSGPLSAAPFKFRVRASATITSSTSINIGTSLSNMWEHSLGLGVVSYASGTWYEYTLTEDQANVLSTASSIFLEISGYDNPSFYTSGANIPSIITTEPNSARIKVGGAWKSGIPYIKVGGVWKRGEMYIKQGGIWKKGS